MFLIFIINAASNVRNELGIIGLYKHDIIPIMYYGAQIPATI